jgi:hypothetical protein
MPNSIIITSMGNNCWNKSLGWVDRAQATEFTPEEKATFPLPVGGAWFDLKPKEKPVCRECGSDDVRADAYAVWNVEAQEWEVSATFDKGSVCEKCGGECSLKWIEV